MKSKDSQGNPIPFDIDFVGADLRRKKAGKIHKLSQMTFLFPKGKKSGSTANHFLNGTINIQPAGGGPITKVHIILIRGVNGKNVV